MIHRRHFLHAGAAALGLPSPFGASWAAMPGRADNERAAAHLLNRLGFGPRPGDLAAVAADPPAWIERQLAPQSLPLPERLTARLEESRFIEMDPVGAVRELAELQRDNKVAANAMASMPTSADRPPMSEADAQRRRANSPVGQFVRGYQVPAVQSRLFRALESPRQLEEAMVDFWFNHFNVYQNKNYLRVLVGHYEHHAIRPYALGRFRDLLGATAHHPAMLYYLDNWNSVGPQGEARGRGLNENYARELMELHTLGVDGGYSQQDVTQLARMLTGWTILPPRSGNVAAAAGSAAMPVMGAGMPGFRFNERVHDHGDKVWLGHRIAPRGQAEGEFALDTLARHPATARHIAYKLAQYFVSDEPGSALVDRLAAVFLAQDGQVVPVLRTLFASDEFWSPANLGAKFKTPYHYTLSALRAGGWTLPTGVPLAMHLAAEGMPLFGCQTPDGYKNTEGAWLSPDGLGKRLEFATQVARGRLGREQLAGGLGADELMNQLGPLVTPATRALVGQRRGDAAMAVALVLAGPGMMRR